MLKHRADIDGLRALAILPVLFFHAGFTVLGGGYLGVDVFFVISGFLISSLLIKEAQSTGRIDFLKFYERRVKRIAPALYVMLLATTAAACFVLVPADLTALAESQLAALVFVSNIYFWQKSSYFDIGNELKPLLHTWSLSVEEQFYVFFPLLLLAIKTRSTRFKGWVIGGLLLMSCVLAQVLCYYKPVASFYLLPTRAFEMLAGSMAAYLMSTPHMMGRLERIPEAGHQFIMTAALAAIVLPMLVPVESWALPLPGVISLMPCTGAALVCMLGYRQNWVSRLLSFAPIVGVGLISYSLYLWHQPLFALARVRSVNHLSQTDYLYLIALTFLLAIASWRFVEQPIRALTLKSARPLWLAFALATVALMGVALALILNKGAAWRFDARELALIDIRDSGEKETKRCSGWTGGGLKVDDACRLGKTGPDSPAPSVLVLGDSHAAAIAKSVSAHLSKFGLAGVQITYLGCAPMLNVERVDGPYKCRDFSEKVSKFIERSPNIKTVIVSVRWPLVSKLSPFDNQEGGVEPQRFPQYRVLGGSESPMMRGRMAVEKYLFMGKNVVLVYPVPEVGWDVPMTLLKQATAERTDITTSYDVYLQRTAEARSELDKINADNVYRVYPEKHLCDLSGDRRCVASKQGTPLYFDNNHLTDAGAEIALLELDGLLARLSDSARAEPGATALRPH